MNERIKEVRKESKLNQEDFGARLKITKASISRIEAGINNPSDQTIKLICSEFLVNESWLRTGEGEMFLKPQKNDLVARAAVLLGQKDPVFEAFVETYSKLNPTNRKVLLDFYLDFTENLKHSSAGD